MKILRESGVNDKWLICIGISVSYGEIAERSRDGASESESDCDSVERHLGRCRSSAYNFDGIWPGHILRHGQRRRQTEQNGRHDHQIENLAQNTRQYLDPKINEDSISN